MNYVNSMIHTWTLLTSWRFKLPTEVPRLKLSADLFTTSFTPASEGFRLLVYFSPALQKWLSLWVTQHQMPRMKVIILEGCWPTMFHSEHVSQSGPMPDTGEESCSGWCEGQRANSRDMTRTFNVSALRRLSSSQKPAITLHPRPPKQFP